MHGLRRMRKSLSGRARRRFQFRHEQDQGRVSAPRHGLSGALCAGQGSGAGRGRESGGAGGGLPLRRHRAWDEGGAAADPGRLDRRRHGLGALRRRPDGESWAGPLRQRRHQYDDGAHGFAQRADRRPDRPAFRRPAGQDRGFRAVRRLARRELPALLLLDLLPGLDEAGDVSLRTESRRANPCVLYRLASFGAVRGFPGQMRSGRPDCRAQGQSGQNRGRPRDEKRDR
ncbi:MAG: hypothetical protein BWZ10_02115 [candidate division BRC1 bacterium ADurb.BinA364]|nr:MAG: hypothetical protein BWZ10_02115 [candidate division BRC1 bacterium ADurb.BinA364]